MLYAAVFGVIALIAMAMLWADLRDNRRPRQRSRDRSLEIVFRVPDRAAGARPARLDADAG